MLLKIRRSYKRRRSDLKHRARPGVFFDEVIADGAAGDLGHSSSGYDL
jgi:hypothetical protein